MPDPLPLPGAGHVHLWDEDATNPVYDIEDLGAGHVHLWDEDAAGGYW